MVHRKKKAKKSMSSRKKITNALMNKKSYTKLKQKVKRTVKKVAKQEAKKDLSRIPRIKSRRKMTGRGGSIRQFERVVAREMKQNLGYRSNVQAPRAKISKENVAPRHPLYGVGERRTFEYVVRTLGRTGSDNTSASTSDGLVGTIDTKQNDEVHLFRSEVKTNTFVYDQVLTFNTWYWRHNAPTASCSMGSSLLYTDEANGIPNPTKVSDWLKYKQYYFVRYVEIKYSPSTDRTTKGNITFGMKHVTITEKAYVKESTYDDVYNLNKELKKKSSNVGEPLTLVLLPFLEPNKPAPGEPYPIYEGTGRAGVIDGNYWVLMAACNVTLPSGSADVLGKLSVKFVIDAYGDSWDPISIQPTLPTSSFTPSVFQSSSVESKEKKERTEIEDKSKEEMLKMMKLKMDLIDKARESRSSSSSTTATDTTKAKSLTSEQSARLRELLKDPNAN